MASNNNCAAAAIGAAEYAAGAKDLASFSKRVKAKFGDQIPDPVLQAMFLNAADRYRRDARALTDIKQELYNAVGKEVRANQPAWKKAVNAVTAGRSVRTSIDMSAVLNQGGFLVAADPRRLRGLGEAFRAFRSEDAANYAKAEIESRPNYDLYKESGLHLTSWDNTGDLTLKEEAFQSDLGQKVPGVRASERAYVVFLNRLRADAFDMFYGQLTKNGRTASETDVKAIADFINNATGRGTGAVADKAASALNGAIFSPRWVASRANMLTGRNLLLPVGGSVRARTIVAREYAQYAAALVTFYTLAELSGGEVEKDRRSSNFGHIRFGNLDIDPTSGLGALTRTFSQIASGQKKSQSGKVYNAEPAGIAADFGRGKLAPLPSSAVDFAFGRAQPEKYDAKSGKMIPERQQTAYMPNGSLKAPAGRDFLGRDVMQQGGVGTNLAKAAGVDTTRDAIAPRLARAFDYYFTKNAVPITFDQFADAMAQQGVPLTDRTASVLLGIFGANSRTIDPKEMQRRAKAAPNEKLPTTRLIQGVMGR